MHHSLPPPLLLIHAVVRGLTQEALWCVSVFKEEDVYEIFKGLVRKHNENCICPNLRRSWKSTTLSRRYWTSALLSTSSMHTSMGAVPSPKNSLYSVEQECANSREQERFME